MDSIKVVIIDNGVNEKLLQSLFPCDKSINCMQVYKDEYITQFMLPLQTENHGSVCTAILMEYLKKNEVLDEVDITSISILNDKREQHLDDFVSALKWCVDQNADLVLMSIGIKTLLYANQLLDMIKISEKNRMILIAATANEPTITYPACFNNVIGVRKKNDSAKQQDEICVLKNVMDGVEVEAIFINSIVMAEYNRIYNAEYGISNSFVVPFVAAYVCKILQIYGRMSKKKILAKLVLNHDLVESFKITQKRIKGNIPVFAVQYNLDMRKEGLDILSAIILKFSTMGYSCACLTDIITENIYDKSIFHIPGDKVDEWLDSYCQLLSNNSLLVIWLNDQLAAENMKNVEDTFLCSPGVGKNIKQIANQVVDWIMGNKE